MITIAYLWLFVAIAIFFLYLGWTKKQFMMIIIAGLFFILCVAAVGDGLVISDHVLNTTTTNDTIQKAVVTSYSYGHEMMTNFMSNILITFFLSLAFICIGFGITMIWLNPNMDDKSKENGGREFWDQYD